MLVVAALWVCAFGVMFAFMSREVKGLRQVVRAKVRDFTDVPVPGLRFFFSDVGSSHAGWQRGFEDESPVPSAVRRDTFPAGGRKRVY